MCGYTSVFPHPKSLPHKEGGTSKQSISPLPSFWGQGAGGWGAGTNIHFVSHSRLAVRWTGWEEIEQTLKA